MAVLNCRGITGYKRDDSRHRRWHTSTASRVKSSAFGWRPPPILRAGDRATDQIQLGDGLDPPELFVELFGREE